MTDNEQFLLAGLANNDKNAIELIYKMNYAVIQSFILNNNGDTDDAKDIFQEGMIILYEKSLSDKFQLNCLIKTFLFSVCKNLWFKRLQQKKQLGEHKDVYIETLSVEEEMDVHEQKNNDFLVMESAMTKIGEPCKSILEAYYIYKKNMIEIATAFGYTNADNAKTQKYKCLMRLKKLFFAQHKYEK